MCKISNTIRFCTCKVKNVSSLKHYWALYRFAPEKEVFILGEPIWPIHDDMFEVNQAILLDVLNNHEPFDVEFDFEHKDKFVLELFHGDRKKRKSYTCEYYKNKWRASTSEFFELISHFEEVAFGNLKYI